MREELLKLIDKLNDEQIRLLYITALEFSK